MTAIEAAILAIDILFEVQDRAAAYQRLASGITANAEAQGREVTDDEKAVINGVLDAAEARRKGE